MDKSDKEFLKKNKDVLSYEEIIKLYKEGKITKEELEKKVKIRERFDKLNNDKEFEDYRNKEIAHAILDIGTALIPFGGGAKIGGKIIGAGIKKVAPKASEKVTKAIVNKAIEITEKEIKKLTTHTGKKIAETLVKKTPKDIATGALIGGIHGGISASIDNKNPASEIIKEGSVGAVIGLGASVIGGKIAQKVDAHNLKQLPLKEKIKPAKKYYSDYERGIKIENDVLGRIKMTSDAYKETLKQNLELADNVIDLSKDIKKAKYIRPETPAHEHKNYDIIMFHRLKGKKAEYIISENKRGEYYFYKVANPEVTGIKTPISKPATIDSEVMGSATPASMSTKKIIPNSKSNLNTKNVKLSDDKNINIKKELYKIGAKTAFVGLTKLMNNLSEKENKTIRLKGGISINYDGIEVDGKKYKDWSKKEKEAFWEGFSSNSFTNSKPYKSNIKIDNKTNNSKPRKMHLNNTDNGHWVTIDHRHVFIED